MDIEQLNKIISDIVRYRIYRNISFLLVPLLIGIYLVIRFNNKLNFLIKKIHVIEDPLKDELKNLKNCYQKINDADTYFVHSKKQNVLNQFTQYKTLINSLKKNKKIYQILKDTLDECEKEINDLIQLTENYNKRFIQKRKQQYQWLFAKLPYPLDDQQKTAIITDDTHNLVVAGAGAGKTEVLVTRIAYLIERKPDTINPERILALAYQRKASQEMRDRIKQRYNRDVEIRTFHSLGFQIVQSITGKAPLLLGGDNHDRAVDKLIASLFQKNMQIAKFRNAVINYMGVIGNEEKFKEEADFKTKEDYYEYKRKLKLVTLDNHEVKSQGEQDIMNFFITHMLNGKDIKIIYEQPAEWMKYLDKDGVEQQPKPDFYLPEHDIYFEHWSLGVDGKPPPWYEEDYIANMEKKKEKFIKNGKTLVETTAGERVQNQDFTELIKQRFIEKIKEKYPNEKFEITPIPYERLVEKVWDNCKSYVNKLPQNIKSFITVAKTNKFTTKDIFERLTKEKWSYYQRTFALVAVQIFEAYEIALNELHCIDYQDMINQAIDMLEDKKDLYRNKYDHILIDEYQDISDQRYRLIKTLMERNDGCKLFCVGDDWQSIMGFTGSNLDFFINFDKYFDHPARTDLTINYRSITSIVETSKEIIDKNKHGQLKKEHIAHIKEIQPITIYHSMHSPDYVTQYYQQICNHCLSKIKEHLDNGYNPNDIMILSRILNNPKLKDILYESSVYSAIPVHIPQEKNQSSWNKVPFMSVHQAKGLEGRAVFLIDVCQGFVWFSL